MTATVSMYDFLTKNLHKSEKEAMQIINNPWSNTAQYYLDLYNQELDFAGVDDDGTERCKSMTNQEQYDDLWSVYEAKEHALTNKELIDFLAKQFDVSRTTAKKMLHVLMKLKKYDNINKLFQGTYKRNTKFDIEMWTYENQRN